MRVAKARWNDEGRQFFSDRLVRAPAEQIRRGFVPVADQPCLVDRHIGDVRIVEDGAARLSASASFFSGPDAQRRRHIEVRRDAFILPEQLLVLQRDLFSRDGLRDAGAKRIEDADVGGLEMIDVARISFSTATERPSYTTGATTIDAAPTASDAARSTR